jgi:uncharacterized transporter YbjL
MYPENIDGANNMAIACAVGYPFGLIGVILCVVILKKTTKSSEKGKPVDPAGDNTFITEYLISNPEIIGKTIQEIRKGADVQFVISRIWKGNKVIIPTSDTVIEQNEHVLVISGKKDVNLLKELFGPQENIDWNKKGIDWNAIDNQLVSRKILVTKPEVNGVKLGSLRLRNSFGINITRVNRAGIDLLPSTSLRLQLGDRLTIVGGFDAQKYCTPEATEESILADMEKTFAILAPGKCFVPLCFAVYSKHLPFIGRQLPRLANMYHNPRP